MSDEGNDERAGDCDEIADVIAFPEGGRESRRYMRDALGEVLREERHRQGRSLADVADRAAVSLPYLSEVERGRKEVSSELLDAITTALGVETAEVIERTARRMRLDASLRFRVQCGGAGSLALAA